MKGADIFAGEDTEVTLERNPKTDGYICISHVAIRTDANVKLALLKDSLRNCPFGIRTASSTQ